MKIAVAIIILLRGIYRLVEPKRSMGFFDLKTASPRGVTEMRAVPGGMLIGLGIAVLVFPIPAVYKALAIIYTVMAAIRVVSIAADKTLDKQNGICLAFDIIMAVLLFL
jgi:hypothetical protein